MKKLVVIILILVLLFSCSLLTPKGRWNPNDPQYDEATDPDAKES